MFAIMKKQILKSFLKSFYIYFVCNFLIFLTQFLIG